MVEFLRHLFGLCGSPHPNLFIGGLISSCIYCYYYFKYKIKRK